MQGCLTQLNDDHTLEKLNISIKSVADYFKDKLRTKTSGRSSPLLLDPCETDVNTFEASRGGLGSTRLGLGALMDEGLPPRTGLGANPSGFTSLMSSKFLASLPTAMPSEASTPLVTPDDFAVSRKQSTEKPSGEKMEQTKTKKGEKKERRKRDKAMTQKSIDCARTSDEDGEVENWMVKSSKRRKDTDGDLVQAQERATNDNNTTKSDKARKMDKVERKAKKLTQ